MTGVGSAFVTTPIYNLPTQMVDEFTADGLGARHYIGIDKLIVVSMGTGTTFVKIDGVLNEWGTIPVDKEMKSGVEGIYAGGDVLPRDIRQIYLAEHDGNVAAKSIINYLNK